MGGGELRGVGAAQKNQTNPVLMILMMQHLSGRDGRFRITVWGEKAPEEK